MYKSTALIGNNKLIGKIIIISNGIDKWRNSIGKVEREAKLIIPIEQVRR